MPPIVAASTAGPVLVELGLVLVALAVVGRIAARIGFPAIPLYLVAGLLMGEGGVLSLDASTEFIRIGADVGVVMLLLLLGLEYSPTELHQGLRRNWAAGLVDLLANFTPGLLAGLLLGWGVTAAVLLGGITYISSSGIIARQLGDLDRIANRETPVVLSVLVIEDLLMAVYLPIAGVLIVGATPLEGVVSVSVALGVVVVALVVAMRFGGQISRLLDTGSPEMLLFTVLGTALAVAGLAESLQVSAAVGAFLLGVAISGTVAERGREVLLPVRDVFSGLFFVYFGIQVVPGDLVPVLPIALGLALVTALTKAGSGWWAAARAGIGRRGRLRTALSLTPRGEFSVVIAGLAVAGGIGDDLGPLTAAYVMVMAIGGSLLMRYADDVPLPPAKASAPARSA